MLLTSVSKPIPTQIPSEPSMLYSAKTLWIEENPMLFPYTKGSLDHDKKKCGKTRFGTWVCILTKKKSKVYNIYGSEGL